MDEEKLLAAVNETPGDPAPRLVYADWLEENGDARSEYFRAEHRLRTAPLGDPSRQALGRAWRELRATLDPQWLARVDPGAPVPAWVPIEARNPPHAGLDDWQEWARQSHYEWVILTVLAPIDAVVGAVIQRHSGWDPEAALASGIWRRGVPVTRWEAGDPVESAIPFVQLKGHAWTVAMYDTFNLTMPSYNAAQADARELSYRLGTLAVEYSEEDTSGATGYQLFECGELIEFAENAGGDGTFASKRRPLPWSEFPHDFPDDLFRALGLYLPGFYAATAGVRVGVPEPAAFARADMLDLPRPLRAIPAGETAGFDAEFAEVHRLQEMEEGSSEWWEGDEDDEEIPF